MRTPRYLVESDPLLSNVPQEETVMEVTNEAWTVEELENAERQVEQVLLEEAFIEACFEEMLEEEESQWFHYTVATMPTIMYTTHMPNLQYSTHVPSVQCPPYMPTGQYTDTTYSGNIVYYPCQSGYTSLEQRFNMPSKLNPEAPEFIPRGVAS